MMSEKKYTTFEQIRIGTIFTARLNPIQPIYMIRFYNGVVLRLLHRRRNGLFPRYEGMTSFRR